MSLKRVIVTSIAGGTASLTIQIPIGGKITRAIMSAIPAAAGSWELSKSATSQISTTAPDVSVLARMRFAAPLSSVGVLAPVHGVFELNLPVKILDNLYLHCTGTGNVGELSLVIE
jgi:hypothetical protein